MRKATLSGVAVCAVALFASAATTATTKKKPVKKQSQAASAPAKTATQTAASKATAPNIAVSRTAPKSRAAASKTARTKKTARHAPAGQLAPTKERYQQIQRALASKGYFSGEPNGVWGTDSVEALKRFQADQNLTPDGKLTSLSLIALGLGPKRLSAQTPPAQTDQQQ